MQQITCVLIIVIMMIEGSTGNENDSMYLIKDIRMENSWYMIYAERNGELYKIISNEKLETDNCEKIIVGNSYKLILESRRDNAPEINGIKITPLNYADVKCFHYDEESVICIEPENDIYDLHYTKNLEGTCYVKE